MNRSTGIGRLFREDRETARAEVVRAMMRTRGHVMRTAAMLGIVDRQLYRIIWREALWPELDHARTLPKGTEAKNGLVEKARVALLSRHGVSTDGTRVARAALSREGGDAHRAGAPSVGVKRRGGGEARVRADDVQAMVPRAARARLRGAR